ncbi:MAG: hypothetical protein DWQ19_07595 [Crenarchaeota archaeon]|nr:MAG: hypothetical protein DWQ19_07595 [Thermoproteota archaeon]
MQQTDVFSTVIPDVRDSCILSADFPPMKNHSSNYQKSILARNILFACEDCNGALIPSTLCVVCKKTNSRICVKCSSKIRLDGHKSCECLILLSLMHSEKK